MKINAEFIKSQFESIAATYHLKWTVEDEYQLKLSNNLIEIDFQTERWDEGILLSLTNKAKNEFYQFWTLEERKGFHAFSNEYLSIQEKESVKGLEGNDSIVFSFRVLLERHCQDALNGNFSTLGSGDKD